MTRLVAVAGGTGAGKSTIVRALVERLGGCVLDVDSYYHDLSHLSPAEQVHYNYDEPAAIDAALLAEHLRHLAAGDVIEKPVYSFKTHTRVGVELVTPARLLVLDGLFAYGWPAVHTLIDLKVFVDAPADLRLARRLRRDMVERGRTADQALHQYLTTIRPMHDRWVEPLRPHADVVVVNDGPISDAVERIARALRRVTVEESAG